MSIFIGICAYREHDLLETVLDCLSTARWPKDIRFGICTQREPSDTQIDGFLDDPRFRIDDVPFRLSKGLCWARSRVRNLYQGEDFALQLDGHHRFAAGWDATLLEMLEQCGSPKPILGSYAGILGPNGEKQDSPPFAMHAQKFTPGGTILFAPGHIDGWQELSKPVRSRFVSGHFAFTIGKHVEEYAPDPLLFFGGEEISLAIRSFTMGYSLFHPHRTVIWHEYTRANRVKIWDDDPLWHEKDAISKARLRKLLREEENDSDITGFDLGAVRTHRDFEVYAGLNFRDRLIHPDALAGIEPPTSPVWEDPTEPWFKSAHCRSAAHCAACRHDESFRASLVRGGLVGERDFACPFGESPPNPNDGPGTRLASLLKRFGIRGAGNCACHSRVLQMNIAGAEWCRTNADEIFGWMEEESRKRRLPFIAPIARRLVLHCCR